MLGQIVADMLDINSLVGGDWNMKNMLGTVGFHHETWGLKSWLVVTGTMEWILTFQKQLGME